MELDSYLRFLLALVFVLALIALVSWLVRRFGLTGATAAPRSKAGRRLGIVEILPVDAKRRLILLKRDGVEHLVLLGSSSETLIESRIADRPLAEAPPALVAVTEAAAQ
jgi:flagellar protein FliO/FliZ